ncbi:MAG: hypothetical protein P1U40_13110 [Coxiellaceae bacterium]|nr:hypothetical protein [Coxiellaceae bacterium]
MIVARYLKKSPVNLAESIILLCFAICAFTAVFLYFFSARNAGLSGYYDTIGYPLFWNFNNYALLKAYIFGTFAGLLAIGIGALVSKHSNWSGLIIFHFYTMACSVLLGCYVASIFDHKALLVWVIVTFAFINSIKAIVCFKHQSAERYVIALLLICLPVIFIGHSRVVAITLMLLMLFAVGYALLKSSDQARFMRFAHWAVMAMVAMSGCFVAHKIAKKYAVGGLTLVIGLAAIYFMAYIIWRLRYTFFRVAVALLQQIGHGMQYVEVRLTRYSAEWQEAYSFSGFYLVAALVAAIYMSFSFQWNYILSFCCSYIGLHLIRMLLPAKPQLEHVWVLLLTLAMPFVLFSLSTKTGWIDHGKFVPLQWFPLSLAVIVTATQALIFFILTRRRSSITHIKRILAAYCFVPALVFLSLTRVLGPLTFATDFAFGEWVLPVIQGMQGDLPWRDFLFVHGVWFDFINYYLGAVLWEHSIRAAYSFREVLKIPVYWVSIYYFFLVAFRSSALKALIALVFCLSILTNTFRIPLYAFILISLYQWLRYRGLHWCVIYAVLTTIEVAISPEYGVITVGVSAVILLRDYLDKDPRYFKFCSSVVCALTAVVTVSAILLCLHHYGMLNGFIISIVNFSHDHLIDGGIPILAFKGVYTFMALLMGFGLLIAVLMIHKWRQNHSLSAFEYILLATSLAPALFFVKFIGRADEHIYQVIAVAQPALALFVVWVLEQVSLKWLSKNLKPYRYVFYGAVFIAMYFCLIPELWQNISHLKSRLTVENNTLSKDQQWWPGVYTPGLNKRAMVLQSYFSHRLNSNDTVFDFADSTLLIHPMVGVKTASRFGHVAMAGPPQTQRLVIADLEKARPKYVIYHSISGENGWDGVPNEIRHYAIAHYINAHYAFASEQAGTIIFRRNDVVSPVSKEGKTPGELLSCQTGYVSNFFRPSNPVTYAALPFQVQRNGMYTLKLQGWAIAKQGKQLPLVQVVSDGKVVSQFKPDQHRQDITRIYNWQGNSGFDKTIRLLSSHYEIRLVDSKTGSVSQVGRGPWRGAIDILNVTARQHVTLGEVPKTQGVPLYLKIDFDPDAKVSSGAVTITNHNAQPDIVNIEKSADHNQIVVPIGGCYAWNRMVAQQSKSKLEIHYPIGMRIKHISVSKGAA